MASVNANQADAIILADYLLEQENFNKKSQSNNKIKVFVSRFFPEPRYRHILFAFLIGVFITILAFFVKFYFKR